jgi:hypothetical protein
MLYIELMRNVMYIYKLKSRSKVEYVNKMKYLGIGAFFFYINQICVIRLGYKFHYFYFLILFIKTCFLPTLGAFYNILQIKTNYKSTCITRRKQKPQK